ncbi:uncharacterized protein LOC128221284 isoform X2 [Mya arenaria]|uniref:uncharacterized protein LOC128221284 isoform X2 n=1 Tax=Mya arenaria TaxID=6604 RepID=UPI0022E0C2D7|nr:uncharacterized protein LOC128221284 isoform X2 [Mya arenaria]
MLKVESTQASWSKASTKLLIAEMVQYKEKLNAGAMKKKTVMNMICQKLHQNNYLFTEDQVTGRWKTLVRAYKAVKDGQNKSGSGRKTYQYEQELDEYFQGDPIVKPLAIATSGSSSTDKRAMEEESDEIETVESQPKRKRNSASGELVSVLKTCMASQDEKQKKEMERREKMYEQNLDV